MRAEVTLVVRRTIRAPVERVCAAWAEPEQLKRWWGPKGVVCPEAEVDLRVGGRYRIANRFPDGSMLNIVGEFEKVDPPRELVYSWSHENAPAPPMPVTVKFEARAQST